MTEKKNQGFTVSDRRLFTSEGELRKDVAEQAEAPPQTTAQAEVGRPEVSRRTQEPEGPSRAEQQRQAQAYRDSSAELDREAERRGLSAKDLEVSFERFLASLYMSGMVQLGLAHEPGGSPEVDLVAARQSIDSLALLAEKTKGNLTGKEESFLQNALYELRMAYVEVTNALAQGPQQVSAGK
jgi:hypothetical protein